MVIRFTLQLASLKELESQRERSPDCMGSMPFRVHELLTFPRLQGEYVLSDYSLINQRNSKGLRWKLTGPLFQVMLRCTRAVVSIFRIEPCLCWTT